MRTVRVDLSGVPHPQAVAGFADGSLVIRQGPSRDVRDLGRVIRDSLVHVRIGPDGGIRDQLGYFPDRMVYGAEIGNQVVFGALPFAPHPMSAAGDGRFYFGDGERYEIGAYTAAGRLTRLIRRAHVPRAVGADEVERYTERHLDAARTRDRRRFRARWLQELPFFETMPAYDRICLDREGNFWVREYAWPEPSSRWAVFDSSGVWLGAVELPTEFFIREIGADYVLGTVRDDFGVTRVRLHQLIKPE